MVGDLVGLTSVNVSRLLCGRLIWCSYFDCVPCEARLVHRRLGIDDLKVVHLMDDGPIRCPLFRWGFLSNDGRNILGVFGTRIFFWEARSRIKSAA